MGRKMTEQTIVGRDMQGFLHLTLIKSVIRAEFAQACSLSQAPSEIQNLNILYLRNRVSVRAWC